MQHACRGQQAGICRKEGYEARIFLAGVFTATFFLSVIGSISNRPYRWILAGFGGFCGAFFIAAIGGLSALPEFENWNLLLGVGGGLCVASAIHKRDVQTA